MSNRQTCTGFAAGALDLKKINILYDFIIGLSSATSSLLAFLDNRGCHLPWEKAANRKEIIHNFTERKIFRVVVFIVLQAFGVQIAQLVERRTGDRTVTGSILGWSGGRISLSTVNFLCWLSVGVHFSPRYRSDMYKTKSFLVFVFFSFDFS